MNLLLEFAEPLVYGVQMAAGLYGVYLVIVCLLPEFLVSELPGSFYFGGTSLLIVVSVTMDFVAQVHSHLIAHQYEGLIKKAKLRGASK